MNSHPFFFDCAVRPHRRAKHHIHTNSPTGHRGAAQPRRGQARRSHKRKQENVSSEGATNRKGESQPRVSGANTSEINTKDSPTAEPTPLNGGRGDAHQERREGARVSSANRGAQPQRSEDAGGRRKGEKLTNPATAGQKQPRRGKPLCRRRSARGRDDGADRQGGKPTRPTKRAAAGEGAREGSPAGANDSRPARDDQRENPPETGKLNRHEPNQQAGKQPQARRTQARNANKERAEPRRAGPATIAAAPRSG